MTKKEIIQKLSLVPLVSEGGWFRETYRADMPFEKSSLPDRFKAGKYSASTSIYFMLSAEDRSAPHRVPSDETWHFHSSGTSGTHIELLVIPPSSDAKIVKLGADITRGQIPQFTVPSESWMGARIASESPDTDWVKRNDDWVLIAATVSPSFEYADYVEADCEKLASDFPQFADFIRDISSEIRLKK